MTPFSVEIAKRDFRNELNFDMPVRKEIRVVEGKRKKLIKTIDGLILR